MFVLFFVCFWRGAPLDPKGSRRSGFVIANMSHCLKQHNLKTTEKRGCFSVNKTRLCQRKANHLLKTDKLACSLGSSFVKALSESVLLRSIALLELQNRLKIILIPCWPYAKD